MFHPFRLSLLALSVTLLAPALSLAEDDEATEQQTITIRRGDTLSGIAARLWWRQIWEVNKDKISNPDLIYPGQKIVIPAFGDGIGAPGARMRLADLVDVLDAVGEVYHHKPAGTSPLASGDRLLGIGSVRTGNGRASFRMSDGTIARLGEQSTLVFSDFQLTVKDESTRRILSIERGDIALEPFRAGGVQADLEVRVPGAKMAVASKAVDVRVDEQSQARVSVFDGEVKVSSKGAKVALKQGEGALIDGSKVASVELPPAPEPQAPRPIVGPDVTFVWQPAQGAQYYWLTVARDPQMRDIQFTGAVYDANDFAMRFNRNGEYYWTVDSVDSRGFRSRASKVARFTVDPAYGTN